MSQTETLIGKLDSILNLTTELASNTRPSPTHITKIVEKYTSPSFHTPIKSEILNSKNSKKRSISLPKPITTSLITDRHLLDLQEQLKNAEKERKELQKSTRDKLLQLSSLKDNLKSKVSIKAKTVDKLNNKLLMQEKYICDLGNKHQEEQAQNDTLSATLRKMEILTSEQISSMENKLVKVVNEFDQNRDTSRYMKSVIDDEMKNVEEELIEYYQTQIQEIREIEKEESKDIEAIKEEIRALEYNFKNLKAEIPRTTFLIERSIKEKKNEEFRAKKNEILEEIQEVEFENMKLKEAVNLQQNQLRIAEDQISS